MVKKPVESVWDYPRPPKDIMMDLLIKTARTSSCEFKGMAVYFDLVMADVRIRKCGLGL